MKNLTPKKILIICGLLFSVNILKADNVPPIDGVEKLERQLNNTEDVNKEINLIHEFAKKNGNSYPAISLEYAQKGLKLATEKNDFKNIASLKSLIGKIYLELGKKDEALNAINSSIEIANKNNLQKIEAESYIKLGYYWYRVGDSTNTISNYQKGFEIYDELGNDFGIAQSYLKLGWGYYIFGNYEASEKSFQKALKMKELVKKDTNLVINILTGMGAFYLNQSIKQHQTIQYFEKALELAKQQQDKFGIGRIYNALGLLYAGLNNKKTAESFYFKGLEIFKEIENKAEICWLYTQIGELYESDGKLDKALTQFEKALQIVEEIDISTLQAASIYMAIGSVHQKRGEDYNKALRYFEKSLNLAESIKNNYQILNTELKIGECYVEMNNFSEGRRWCKKAWDKIQEHFSLSQDACNCLYKASEGMGDYKNALIYHEKFKMFSDSIHQEELSEEINNLAAKQNYEMELTEIQKVQEIDAANARTKLITSISFISLFALTAIMLLLFSNVKKTAQKEQLQTLSTVRKEMIANVSHDLRTPVTVMTGYLETLIMRLGKTKIEDQERFLNIILRSTEKLSKLIEQLFEYSKLEAKQIDPTKESFQLADLVKDTFSRYQIIAEKKKVKIKMSCEENIPKVYADSILIERVIQNLMDNALKFTPKDGQVSICLTNHKDQVQVEIADTGKGISEEEKIQIFERYKKSKSSNGAGLGLTIVKNILDIHGSKIHVNSSLNVGTKFSFYLPTH